MKCGTYAPLLARVDREEIKGKSKTSAAQSDQTCHAMEFDGIGHVRVRVLGLKLGARLPRLEVWTANWFTVPTRRHI